MIILNSMIYKLEIESGMMGIGVGRGNVVINLVINIEVEVFRFF